MRHSRLARFLTLLFAALQLAAPPVASVSDARLERESAAALPGVGHVEDHSTARCPRVHPADCGLCQFLTALASPARPRASLPSCESDVIARAAAPLGATAGVRVTPALPRAPPAS